MFSWLKSKINNRMISEMEGCIHQNIQFANMFLNKFSSDKSRTHQIYWIEEIRDNSIEIKEKRSSKNLDIWFFCSFIQSFNSNSS